MTHQDTDQAGLGLPSLMVTYAEVSCRYLVQALNDIGSLGLVTRHLLLLQDKAIGVALTQPSNRQSLRQSSHYHLARQLATLQRSELQLTFPQEHANLRGNALSEILSKIHYDPQDLGLACKIPVEVFRPLTEIVNNMTELCGRSAHRHLMLSTDEFKLKYGKIVRMEHKVALNQLTKILNRDQTNADIIGHTFRHSTALSKSGRVIKPPEILSDLTSQGTEHLQSQSMNAIECSALQLLQQHHSEVRKTQDCVQSKRKRGKPQRRGAHTDLCFSRMHTSPNDRRAGRQPDDESGRAPSQAPRHSKHLRWASGQPQRHYIRQEQNRSKTLSKQLYSSRAHATRNARIQGRRLKREREAALKARHQRRKNQKAKYTRRDAKDDDDRSGRKLWLEYKRRLAKANNKRKREDTQRINSDAPTTDLQARSTYPAGGEQCSVSHYLTPIDGDASLTTGSTGSSNKQCAREMQNQLLDYTCKALANSPKTGALNDTGNI